MRAVAVGISLLTLVVLGGCLVGVPADVAVDSSGPPPNATDLSFAEVSGEIGFNYSSIEGGAGNGNDGIYVADYDGDLRDDVLVLGGESPTLFHNTGDEFETSGALPNVSSPDAGRIQSALWLDRDNDGSEDLLLFPRSADPIYLENDGGSFEQRDVGLDDAFTNPVSASTADYNGDGCLDVFVAQYGLWSDNNPQAWQNSYWETDNGNPNALYRGSCGDGFERAEDAGIGPNDRGPHWSLATSFVDLDDDGLPDIHVANDYYNDTIYYNDGDGTFTRKIMGATTDRNGMSSEVAHVMGNDRPEIFVTNIFFPRERIGELAPLQRELITDFFSVRLGKRMHGNNLLQPTGNGYDGLGEQVGLAEGGWGWASALADLDSDGERDAVHSTQTVVTFDKENPVYDLPMVWLQQDGQFYRQDADEIGLESADGRGISRMDYDLDGALDVAVATYDDSYLFYENQAEQGNSLQVVVDGGDAGTAVGAEVYATADGETQQYVSNARADFQSQESSVLHVGLGDAEAVEELRVVWPDGTERTFEDVPAGGRIRITPDGIEQRLDYED
ncbi:CRTAC1 family protein [Salinarchaeum laminariae]|uniref:CRTAC1 family protein n=1 Tax=Salinarchaeum laminariae TaxID=869888 RepID=UPI0020C1764A|nr:CRTAC1 family protein [Salinarchaeum laminariae]